MGKIRAFRLEETEGARSTTERQVTIASGAALSPVSYR